MVAINRRNEEKEEKQNRIKKIKYKVIIIKKVYGNRKEEKKYKTIKNSLVIPFCLFEILKSNPNFP